MAQHLGPVHAVCFPSSVSGLLSISSYTTAYLRLFCLRCSRHARLCSIPDDSLSSKGMLLQVIRATMQLETVHLPYYLEQAQVTPPDPLGHGQASASIEAPKQHLNGLGSMLWPRCFFSVPQCW